MVLNLACIVLYLLIPASFVLYLLSSLYLLFPLFFNAGHAPTRLRRQQGAAQAQFNGPLAAVAERCGPRIQRGE